MYGSRTETALNAENSQNGQDKRRRDVPSPQLEILLAILQPLSPMLEESEREPGRGEPQDPKLVNDRIAMYRPDRAPTCEDIVVRGVDK